MTIAEYKASLKRGELCEGCPRLRTLCAERIRQGTWCVGGVRGRGEDLFKVGKIDGEYICEGERQCVRLPAELRARIVEEVPSPVEANGHKQRRAR